MKIISVVMTLVSSSLIFSALEDHDGAMFVEKGFIASFGPGEFLIKRG